MTCLSLTPHEQVDEEGSPVLDLGHIVHSLNRVSSEPSICLSP